MDINLEGLYFFVLGLGVMLLLGLSFYFYRWAAGRSGAAAQARAAAEQQNTLAQGAQVQAVRGLVRALFFLLVGAALTLFSVMRLLGTAFPGQTGPGPTPTP